MNKCICEYIATRGRDGTTSDINYSTKDLDVLLMQVYGFIIYAKLTIHDGNRCHRGFGCGEDDRLGGSGIQSLCIMSNVRWKKLNDVVLVVGFVIQQKFADTKQFIAADGFLFGNGFKNRDNSSRQVFRYMCDEGQMEHHHAWTIAVRR